MNSHATVSVELAPAAEETGFEQGVQAMRGTLSTTPVGWLPVGWMCWGGVPLGAVLAGVAAVNAPVCITMPRSFRALLVAMGLAALPDWVLHPQQVGLVHTLIGRTVFMTLLGYDVASIAQRVLEGIRLQLAKRGAGRTVAARAATRRAGCCHRRADRPARPPSVGPVLDTAGRSSCCRMTSLHAAREIAERLRHAVSAAALPKAA